MQMIEERTKDSAGSGMLSRPKKESRKEKRLLRFLRIIPKPKLRLNEVLLNWNHELDSNQYLCATFPLVDHDGKIPLPRISASLPPFGEIFA